ncbi:hypothetical protein EVAR_60562_1 [Eumeta japonica]|uniref:Secreted protein n=1 Tax=Eumeta variegata TaxID=151549 RepID=A0A4C1YHX7_EUMVA|nr:hypothetical protein EVAR_60562_1 [Eumeta japonica]
MRMERLTARLFWFCKLIGSLRSSCYIVSRTSPNLGLLNDSISVYNTICLWRLIKLIRSSSSGLLQPILGCRCGHKFLGSDPGFVSRGTQPSRVKRNDKLRLLLLVSVERRQFRTQGEENRLRRSRQLPDGRLYCNGKGPSSARLNIRLCPDEVLDTLQLQVPTDDVVPDVSSGSRNHP